MQKVKLWAGIVHYPSYYYKGHNQSKCWYTCTCQRISSALKSHTLTRSKYIYRSKWINCFWLVKSLSGITEGGKNYSKKQSMVKTGSCSAATVGALIMTAPTIKMGLNGQCSILWFYTCTVMLWLILKINKPWKDSHDYLRHSDFSKGGGGFLYYEKCLFHLTVIPTKDAQNS